MTLRDERATTRCWAQRRVVRSFSNESLDASDSGILSTAELCDPDPS